jgi:AraC-like DNA-binding protein
MTYEEFASDLPLHRTIVFTSAEENEETMQRYGVNQEVRQLGKGRFRAHLAVRSTEQAELFSDRFSTAVSMRLEPPAGTVGFLFPRGASGKFLASGENVANGKLVVLPDGSGTDIVASGPLGSEAILVTKARFVEMIEVLCPTPKSVRPERMVAIQGNTAQLRALRNAVLEFVARPELEPHPEEISNLLAATIAWMGDSSRQWQPEGFSVNGARRRVAKLAQEFLEEHYREAFRIEDLCRVTGVGVRTLQRGFREYFDLTISDYLKAVRLDATHRELVAAHPSQHSVAQIALRNGFSHLGRFSVGFRERFGESPRQTLVGPTL